jgi:hypothetical protein
VLYVTYDGSLIALPFDEGRLEVTGPPTVVEEGVGIDSYAGVGQFDVSDNGHIAYQSGGGVGDEQVVRVDREGNATPVDPEWQGDFENLVLSPDGTRLAVALTGSEGTLLFDASRFAGDNYHAIYGLTPDHSQFVMIGTNEAIREDLILVFNWIEDLKAKVAR